MPFKFFNNPTSKDKNSFSYFKYAFGEIFLVAIGVLIAVQVNNWNEVRLLKIQKKENLLNLYNAIKKDKLDSFTPNLASKSIWNKPVPENYNEEFYKTTIAWVNRSKKMMIQSYAMDELKSSGFYSKLNNENLKTLLNDYYNDLYWVFGDEDNHKNINELHEYLRDKYNLVLSDLAYLKKPIQFIKTEKSLIVRLRLISNRANWRSYRAKVSQLMAEKVLIALKEEIDS
jgi:hypothetical protein